MTKKPVLDKSCPTCGRIGGNYYGSDLNRFIGETDSKGRPKYVSRDMTAINIDCLIYKRSANRLRIIESKHTAEGMPKSQKEVLLVLGTLLQSSAYSKITSDICMVQGNYPYRTSEVVNLDTGERKTLDQDQLIQWLEFKRDLDILEPLEIAEIPQTINRPIPSMNQEPRRLEDIWGWR